jgi:hypothetical protein
MYGRVILEAFIVVHQVQADRAAMNATTLVRLFKVQLRTGNPHLDLRPREATQVDECPSA